MRLLMVEDNATIAKGLEYSLSMEGFVVTICETSKSARERLEKELYDLVILDISLPDGDGFELCRFIKEKSDVPIVFLTAKDEEKDVVYGLELGADDYVTKPFRMRELITRIHTVLRRYSKQEEKKNWIEVKDVKIDINKAQVFKGAQEVVLTALEYKILLMLFTNINQVITREQILEKIWDIAGNFVNDNTLTVYIKRIREKLEDNLSNPQIIKTVRGIGYLVEK